jgi:hypothetical protein
MTERKYSTHIEDTQHNTVSNTFHDTDAQVPQREVLDTCQPVTSENRKASSIGALRQQMNEG